MTQQPPRGTLVVLVGLVAGLVAAAAAAAAPAAATAAAGAAAAPDGNKVAEMVSKGLKLHQHGEKEAALAVYTRILRTPAMARGTLRTRT